MKWDLDSPVTFHADGRTVHDFDLRFYAEDLGIVPSDRKFRWKMMKSREVNLAVIKRRLLSALEVKI